MSLYEPWARGDAGPYLPAGYAEPARYFVAFRTEWLTRLGLSPAYTEVLLACGDSMDPTISDGDLLLIDRRATRIAESGIYVLMIGGAVSVKRVQIRRDGTAVLISDNARYENESITASEVQRTQAVGRVRWFGRLI